MKMSRNAMRSLIVTVPTALALLGWSSPPASANPLNVPRYTVINLSELPKLPGMLYMGVKDINASGQVVGTWTPSTTDGKFHSFLYSEGELIDTTGLGNGNGINDAGQMTRGTSKRAERAINNLGETTIEGWDINDAGTTVGYKTLRPRGESLPYPTITTRDGQTTILDLLPGAKGAAAYGINDKGEVVGGTMEYPSHAFLFDGQRLHDLGTLGGDWGLARDINNKGQIVGSAATAEINEYIGYVSHAFLYEDGRMLDLNDLIPQDLGLTLINAYAINDSGMIIADAREGSLLLTPIASPVPEPSTLALVLFGLLATAARRRLASRRAS